MKTKKLVTYGLIIAIILLMAFTPLGYLKTMGVEITFLTIPVVVGAIILGPTAGLIFGAVFGLTSFAQCFGLSPFGAALLAINPVFDFIICLIPRMLMGYLTGLIFEKIKSSPKPKNWQFGLSSVLGAFFNTLFFMVFLILLFGRSDYISQLQGGANVFAFVVAFVGINGLIEAISCFIISTAISRALYKTVTTD